jgi:glycosyltransferase involved in cell wall biosynthesis
VTIAVIIPTIPERAHLLTRALASVTAQTLQPDEVCIAIARPDEPAWATRHRALRMATAEWIAPLDDDDEFLPHHLERCAAHQAATGADMVFPWFVEDHCSDPFPGEFGTPWDPAHPRQTTTVIFARRDAVLDVGGYRFDDGDRHDHGGNRAGEDFDLVKRLNVAGYRIEHLPERTWVWWHWSDEFGTGNTSGLPERRILERRVVG